MKHNKNYFRIILVFICLFIGLSANAQCPNPFDPMCETGDPDLQVPLDTNVIVLLIGSAVIGVYFLLKQRDKATSA